MQSNRVYLFHGSTIKTQAGTLCCDLVAHFNEIKTTKLSFNVKITN
jgi:hypothetical protein